MAEEELVLSKEYLKGFNDAYRLSEAMPQIFKGLEGIEAEKNDYNEGFDNGRKQYLRDKHYNIDQDHSGDRTRGRDR